MSKHEPLPPLRADVRTVAWWLVIGFTVGVSWAGSSEASAVEA